MVKPTLAIIPGLIDSLTCLSLQNRLLSLCVLNIDLLGYGAFRDADCSTLTLHDQAKHVAEMIEQSQHSPVWLLAHSLGGAIGFMLARDWPHLVRGIVNVEGNFTQQDTFWTTTIASDSQTKWEERFQAMIADPSQWLIQCGIEPSPQRIDWATQLLANQPASTVYAMSKAALRETLSPTYLCLVREVVQCGVPVHLLAGQRSAADWGLPENIRSAAASYTEIPDTGHLMMLESPDLFCQHIKETCES